MPANRARRMPRSSQLISSVASLSLCSRKSICSSCQAERNSSSCTRLPMLTQA